MQHTYSSVGMVEFNSIAAGIDAADQMMKTAQVQALFFKTICPGKYLAAVCGDVASVNTSVKNGQLLHPENVVDFFVISNIHRDVLKALSGGGVASKRKSLGIIETFSAVSIVQAADAAVKAANVELLDVRTALGLGGKGYALINGDVSAVKTAVIAGAAVAGDNGLLVSTAVIASPHPSVFEQLC